jgi:hypothetical protein
MTLWILFSKPWDLDIRLRGCGIHAIDGIFFKFLMIRAEDSRLI